ncbi:NlpC/P60 family protein [Streptomyces sp. NPDC092296]|uniref:C40 family peptidase n=1 Tax=Streptomyces sp. NPDC092296 TaxID=3366012 RepID=UPI0037F19139
MAVTQQAGSAGGGAARPWLRAALRCGAVLAAAALAVPATAQLAYAAPAGPHGKTVGKAAGKVTGADPLADTKATLGPLLDRLHELYDKAEQATENYNQATEQLSERQAAVVDIDLQVAQKQTQVDQGTSLAAELASAQYRNGQLSGYAELMLSKSPYEALDRGQALQRAGDAQASLVDGLKADQAALAALKKKADEALLAVQQLTAAQESARDEVRTQLDEVEKTVASLTGAQRSELEQLEKEQADEAQLAFLATGVLGKGQLAPSAVGRRAVKYALAQVGKPYVWGGAGPDVFDCSGLTSQAWLHAGLPIPRTSQEQWARLTHIPLNQLRPGDLVIYFSGATHVAMYIGGGLIVQAPRPGAFVKVSPVGSMPILGAVRPDPSAADDGGSWKVPDIPGGTDTTTPILGSDIIDGGKPRPLGPAKPTGPATPKPVEQPPRPKPTVAPSTPAGPSASPSGSATGSPSPGGSASASPSGSATPSGSASATATGSASASASGSASLSASESAAASDEASAPEGWSATAVGSSLLSLLD